MYLAIEGPIGVGKTTLARLLQPIFSAELLLEVFEENPFLPAFYADRARYAFQTQMFFLLSRYQQQRRAVPEALSRDALVADYTFAKDGLFARLNLSGDELEMYYRVHEALAEKIPTPDLVIHLKADTEALLQRIAFRDRPYERQIDRAYLEEVRLAYEAFFRDYTASPVLSIDTQAVNFLTDPVALERVVERVRSALGIGTYQPSLPLEGLQSP